MKTLVDSLLDALKAQDEWLWVRDENEGDPTFCTKLNNVAFRIWGYWGVYLRAESTTGNEITEIQLTALQREVIKNLYTKLNDKYITQSSRAEQFIREALFTSKE